MKKFWVIILISLFSCKGGDTESTKMPGSYNMVYQKIKGDITDTTFFTLEQLKIFTNNYMMYANVILPDSTSAFGIGTYTFNNDTLIENVFYSSSDTSSSDEPRSYTLAIEKTERGFRQIIGNFMNGDEKVTLTEEYTKNETAPTTPLDGTWKLIKKYTITGEDTASLDDIQYKVYFQGYCIWGNTYRDASNQKHTGIGFGKFVMEGDNKVKESMKASTFSGVREHEFELDIEMDGRDKYKQTITNDDGSKGVEIYERMIQN